MTPTHTTSTARLQTRLERLELEHLRAVCAEMGQEIELLRRENAHLADVAECWQQDHQNLTEHLQNDTADARSVGLTQSGEQIVVREEVAVSDSVAGQMQALNDRAKTGLLTAAINGSKTHAAFWEGTAHACRMLSDGGAARMAEKDARSSGYEPPPHFKAAWADLPDAAENITIEQAQRILATHGLLPCGDVDADKIDDIAARRHNGGAP